MPPRTKRPVEPFIRIDFDASRREVAFKLGARDALERHALAAIARQLRPALLSALEELETSTG